MEVAFSEILRCLVIKGVVSVPVLRHTIEQMYDMDWEWNDRVNGLESELVQLEQVISRARARQAEILSQLDRMQVDLSDGDRGMEDWTAARLDVSRQTAHRLMTIAHSDDRWLLEQFKAGRFGLDRASHLVKLAATGCPTDLFLEAADDYSLGRLWGLVEERREVSATHEQFSFESRYLVIQPSLDESMFKLWGQLYGLDGEMVDKALRQKADEFPSLPGQSQGQQLADALTAVCADSLTGSSEPGKEGRAVTVAEIFVDANLAAPSFGEAGVTTSSGLRVGPTTLSEILCEGRVRVVYTDGDKGQLPSPTKPKPSLPLSEPGSSTVIRANVPSKGAAAATGSKSTTSTNDI